MAVEKKEGRVCVCVCVCTRMCVCVCVYWCVGVGMYMYVCVLGGGGVNVWMCGCVDVWAYMSMCNASISLSSLLFSLPVGVSRFWAVMAHASCVLVPGVVMSTVSCCYSGFGRDHDVSPHFLLDPFLSPFAKSFFSP